MNEAWSVKRPLTCSMSRSSRPNIKVCMCLSFYYYGAWAMSTAIGSSMARLLVFVLDSSGDEPYMTSQLSKGFLSQLCLAFTCTTQVGPNPTQNYGTLIVSGIKYDDGSQVTISDLLGVILKSPAAASTNGIVVCANPRRAVSADVTMEQIDESTKLVTAKPTNLTNIYTGLFLLAAEALTDIDGTVEIATLAAPDPAPVPQKVMLSSVQGLESYSASFLLGVTTSVQIPSGMYRVLSVELAPKD
ncbi:uncharacterized protein MAM_00324 [Metarhizium album ARSEF 1941]|uniref:Uncharacterized protein n=1 Tax=Metarhizium album (strain ARSEF 1941) TaxID=1081103 RepID=A0A0B2X6F7_METAS|nr:uncharacterized protein MAM_00324 [Metarhizium album ARSEF 1941]KHO01323.1 hypothetical protein MAM_00324 [Metarhizium album ARSEF 1941]